MELVEMVAYARRVAFKMSKDPEMGSIANRAGWRAFRTFDVMKGVPPERWVSLVTRQIVWQYWRKRAKTPVVYKSPGWWEDAIATRDAPPDETTWTEGYQMACEQLMQKWPLDIIARRHGKTVSEVNRMIKATIARLGR